MKTAFKRSMAMLLAIVMALSTVTFTWAEPVAAKAPTKTALHGVQQRDRATELKARLGKTETRNTSELTVRSIPLEGCPSSPRYRGSKEVPCWRSNAGGTAESRKR